ncbi:hypothetical protein NLX62_07825, partial [Mycobacteriaceae bacterium Msp059]|nr:hypothetical protein [Mycobacteriaceae bacterium Msp059]
GDRRMRNHGGAGHLQLGRPESTLLRDRRERAFHDLRAAVGIGGGAHAHRTRGHRRTGRGGTGRRP